MKQRGAWGWAVWVRDERSDPWNLYILSETNPRRKAWFCNVVGRFVRVKRYRLMP